MERLNDKIKNQSTELQQSYSQFMVGLIILKDEELMLRLRLKRIEEEINDLDLLVEKCKQRAIDQGYPNLLD